MNDYSIIFNQKSRPLAASNANLARLRVANAQPPLSFVTIPAARSCALGNPKSLFRYPRQPAGSGASAYR